MARIEKIAAKKNLAANKRSKIAKNNTVVINKSTFNNNIFQHLLHPDYVLFDWEFFSRELEFE